MLLRTFIYELEYLVRLVPLSFVHLAIDNQQTRPQQSLRHTIHLAAPGVLIPQFYPNALRDGSSPPVFMPSYWKAIQWDHYYSHHVPLDIHLLMMEWQTTFPDRGPGLQQPGICAPSCRLSINQRRRTGLISPCQSVHCIPSSALILVFF